MKKFNFTLQALLHVTISLEKEQKSQLLIINKQIEILQLEQNILMDEISNSIELYLEQIKGFSSINHVKIHNDYLSVLNKKNHSILLKIDKTNIEKQQLQDMLVETMVRRKSLEKLKDKQYKVYLKELQKEQENLIDEFASYSFIQN